MEKLARSGSPSISELWRLACLDAIRDKRISICMIAAIVSVIAPLLLLLGLKNGVVSQMREELKSQPQNLELRMVGSHTLTSDWFLQTAKLAQVGYVVALTRSLNATGDLRSSIRGFVANAELIPSTDGDPLLQGHPAPRGLDQAWLSEPAARELSLSVGETFSLIIARKRDNQTERLTVKLRVMGITKTAMFGRAALLISPELLIALEDFRDGKVEPTPGALKADYTPPARTQYPRARIYAKSIDDVPTLVRQLANQGIDTTSRMADIEAVKSIDGLLRLLFNVIAWLGIIGCTASLMGAFAANIDRKRRDLALLRLMGYSRHALVGYILIQALVLTVAGMLIGMGAYAIASHSFDIAIGQALPAGQYVSVLTGWDLMLAATAAIIVAAIVALAGGTLVMRVDASEALRDV